MIKPLNPHECCGCGSCAAICPKGAITMERGADGAAYPQVMRDLCIDCGLCEIACDFSRFQPTGKDPSEVYAARMKDPGEVASSRSGGFFMALCQDVTDRGGVVFGSRLDTDCRVVHTAARSYEECRAFKGSKYAESNLGKTFSECREALKSGTPVLFSGTGCQAHALLRYLETTNTSTKNLLTVDIICHGAPTAGAWDAYREVIEKREGAKMLHFDFRDKSNFTWEDNVETYVLADGTQKSERRWTKLFYSCHAFRESCYHCKYTTAQRRTDITIGDYWGIERNAPRFNDHRGVSLVLLHTEKGAEAFRRVRESLDFEPTDLATSMQPQLIHPSGKKCGHRAFRRRFAKNPYRAVEKYTYPSLPVKLYRKAINALKRCVKKILHVLHCR